MRHQIVQFILQNAMGFVLFIIMGALLIGGWRAQKDTSNRFNVWDLVMDTGKASRIGVSYMAVLVITSWVVISEALHDKLTETVFGIYCAAWVTPLVAKVIFNKNDMTDVPFIPPQPKHPDDDHH